MDQHSSINNLLQQYFNASNKLKKFERIIFKRFAPNVADVSSEFHRLAVQFEQCSLYPYAGMCYLGASKCQKSLANSASEIDFYMKSARAFVKANAEKDKLNLRSNNKEFIEGALKSYNNALVKLNNDSAMKAALIREMKAINPSFESYSSFSSPCHRIHDLETSAFECIDNEEFLQALEKLTDIFDNITERKKENFYIDILNRIEIMRLLLLIILELPPSRQSPSHIILIQKYAVIRNLDEMYLYKNSSNQQLELQIPPEIINTMEFLVQSWLNANQKLMLEYLTELSGFESFTKYQRKLINFLIVKYSV